MSSPEKKIPTPNPSLESLPHDLLLSCLARVSRLYYPTLSLVSKSFRSLLNSPELYETRSTLHCTESCLYVCLKFPSEPNPRWYTLCRKPERTLNNTITKKKNKEEEPSGYLLVQVPILHSPTSPYSSLVAVGSNIYNIGGHIHNKPSSSVSILDCKSHTWHEGPSMIRKRKFHSASVIDGKIYVGGSCNDGGSSGCKSIEMFDSKTQIWDLVFSPYEVELNWLKYNRSACIERKIYLMSGPHGLSYEPEEGKWDWVQRQVLGGKQDSELAIKNVLYGYNEGEVRWYDTKVRLWKELEGLERLPKIARYSPVKLADYGGKMVILWDRYVRSSGYKNKMIWCAVIALGWCECNCGRIFGKVDWCDAVLTVPKSYKLKYALAATL